jgi:thioredoxin 1
MEAIMAPHRNLTALAAVLLSLVVTIGCESTGKLLRGKRHKLSAEDAAEVISLTDQKSTELSEPAPDSAPQPRPDPQPVAQIALADYEQSVPSPDSTGHHPPAPDVRPPVVQAAAEAPIFSEVPHAIADLTGTVQHVGTQDFDQQVLGAQVPVLVDFYADWCGPCKQLAPTLDRIASGTAGAKVVKVNIDDSPELAAKYQVHSLPTVMVFKNGAVVARSGPAGESKLLDMLAQ